MGTGRTDPSELHAISPAPEHLPQGLRKVKAEERDELLIYGEERLKSE